MEIVNIECETSEAAETNVVSETHADSICASMFPTSKHLIFMQLLALTAKAVVNSQCYVVVISFIA